MSGTSMDYLKSPRPSTNPMLPDEDIQLPNQPYLVHDGDTIIDSRTGQKIRLSGADSREMYNHSANTPRQVTAREATESLANYLAPKPVELTPVTIDKYGRPVAQMNGDEAALHQIRTLNALPMYIGNSSADFRAKAEAARWQGINDLYNGERSPTYDKLNSIPVGGPDAYVTKPPKFHSESLLGDALRRGTDVMQGDLYGAGHAVASAINAPDSVTNWMKEGIDRNEREAAMNPARYNSFHDIKGVGDLLPFAAEKAAESIPSMLPMAVGGLAGAAGKTVLGRAAASVSKKALATAGATAAGAVPHLGEIEQDQMKLDQPASFAEKAGGALINSALDVFGVSKGLDQLLGAKKYSGMMNTAKQLAQSLGITSLTEAGTESLQQLVQLGIRAEHDPNFNPLTNPKDFELAKQELLEAGIAGGAAGGLMGVAGRAGGIARESLRNETSGSDTDQTNAMDSSADTGAGTLGAMETPPEQSAAVSVDSGLQPPSSVADVAPYSSEVAPGVAGDAPNLTDGVSNSTAVTPTWDNMVPGQLVTLYRGESADNNPNGDWWTTSAEKAAKYGRVQSITIRSDELQRLAARGHGGADEFVLPRGGTESAPSIPDQELNAKSEAFTPENTPIGNAELTTNNIAPNTDPIAPNPSSITPNADVAADESPVYLGDHLRSDPGVSSLMSNPKKRGFIDKDLGKADRASKFIGFGATGSSTETYRSAADKIGVANTGDYSEDDNVFISINGNRAGAIPASDPRYQAELDAAAKEGVMFITDDEANANRGYNTGERALHEALVSRGYKHVGEGEWLPDGAKWEAWKASVIPKSGIEPGAGTGIEPNLNRKPNAGEDAYDKALREYAEEQAKSAKPLPSIYPSHEEEQILVARDKAEGKPIGVSPLGKSHRSVLNSVLSKFFGGSDIKLPEIRVSGANGGESKTIKGRLYPIPGADYAHIALHHSLFEPGREHAPGNLLRHVLAHEIGHSLDHTFEGSTNEAWSVDGQIQKEFNEAAAALNPSDRSMKANLVRHATKQSDSASPKELFADAFSLFINNPEYLHAISPTAYDTLQKTLPRTTGSPQAGMDSQSGGDESIGRRTLGESTTQARSEADRGLKRQTAQPKPTKNPDGYKRAFPETMLGMAAHPKAADKTGVPSIIGKFSDLEGLTNGAIVKIGDKLYRVSGYSFPIDNEGTRALPVRGYTEKFNSRHDSQDLRDRDYEDERAKRSDPNYMEGVVERKSPKSDTAPYGRNPESLERIAKTDAWRDFEEWVSTMNEADRKSKLGVAVSDLKAAVKASDYGRLKQAVTRLSSGLAKLTKDIKTADDSKVGQLKAYREELKAALASVLEELGNFTNDPRIAEINDFLEGPMQGKGLEFEEDADTTYDEESEAEIDASGTQFKDGAQYYTVYHGLNGSVSGYKKADVGGWSRESTADEAALRIMGIGKDGELYRLDNGANSWVYTTDPTATAEVVTSQDKYYELVKRGDRYLIAEHTYQDLSEELSDEQIAAQVKSAMSNSKNTGANGSLVFKMNGVDKKGRPVLFDKTIDASQLAMIGRSMLGFGKGEGRSLAEYYTAFSTALGFMIDKMGAVIDVVPNDLIIGRNSGGISPTPPKGVTAARAAALSKMTSDTLTEQLKTLKSDAEKRYVTKLLQVRERSAYGPAYAWAPNGVITFGQAAVASKAGISGSKFGGWSSLGLEYFEGTEQEAGEDVIDNPAAITSIDESAADVEAVKRSQGLGPKRSEASRAAKYAERLAELEGDLKALHATAKARGKGGNEDLSAKIKAVTDEIALYKDLLSRVRQDKVVEAGTPAAYKVNTTVAKLGQYFTALADKLGMKAPFAMVDTGTRDAMVAELKARRAELAKAKVSSSRLTVLDRTIDKLANATESMIIYNDQSEAAVDRVPIIFIADVHANGAKKSLARQVVEAAHEFGHLIKRTAVDQLIERAKANDADAIAILNDMFGEVNWDSDLESWIADERFANQIVKWTLTNAVPKTLAQGFFKSIGARLRSMYQWLKSRFTSAEDRSQFESIERFMNAMMLRTGEHRAAYVSTIEPLEAAEARYEAVRKMHNLANQRLETMKRVWAEKTHGPRLEMGKTPEVEELIQRITDLGSSLETLELESKAARVAMLAAKAAYDRLNASTDRTLASKAQTYQSMVSSLLTGELSRRNKLGATHHHFTAKEFVDSVHSYYNKSVDWTRDKPVVGTVTKTMEAMADLVGMLGEKGRAVVPRMYDIHPTTGLIGANWATLPGMPTLTHMKKVFINKAGKIDDVSRPFVPIYEEIRLIMSSLVPFNEESKSLVEHMADILEGLPKIGLKDMFNSAKRAQIAQEYAQVSDHLHEFTLKLRKYEDLTDAEKRITDFFTLLNEYFVKSDTYSLKFETRKAYYPLTIDKEKWLAEKAGVIQDLISEGYSADEASKFYMSVVDSHGVIDNSLIDDIILASGVKAKYGRKLSLQLQRKLYQRGVYSNDVHHTVRSYTHQLTKRAVEQTRFGDYKKEWDPNKKNANGSTGAFVYIKDGNGQYVFDPMGQVNNTLDILRHTWAAGGTGGISPDDYVFLKEQALPALRGTLGGRIDPKVNALMDWTMFALNVVMLPLSVFSQLPDLAGIANMRGRTLLQPVRAMGDFKKVMKVLWDKGYHEQMKRAAMISGSIEPSLVNSVLSESMANEYVTPSVQKWSETFFTVVQMKRFTDFSRILATSFAFDALNEYADNPAGKAKFLKELHLSKDQLMAWDLDGRPQDPESLMRHPQIRAALGQWTDFAILRPNAAIRPVIGSDPRWKLFFHLKDYLYAYYYTAMSRAWVNMRDDPNFAYALPMLSLGAFSMALALAGYELRKFITQEVLPGVVGLESKANPNEDLVMESLQRSGFMGPFSIIHDMWNAEKRGQSALSSLMGPAFTKAMDFSDKDLPTFFAGNIPVVAQSSPIRHEVKGWLKTWMPDNIIPRPDKDPAPRDG